jgi:hypothetical protein
LQQTFKKDEIRRFYYTESLIIRVLQQGATLAQYANSGVKVYYVCSTRGEEGNVDLECLKGVPFHEITFTKD